MKRNLRDALASFVPKWLSNRPPITLPNGQKRPQNIGFAWLWTWCKLLDIGLEAAYQGLIAQFPITAVKVGRTDSLPYLGRTRGIVQGETEPAAAYAQRLAAWLDTWTGAGWELALATEIVLYLANAPVVSIITRGAASPGLAHWTILNAGVVSRFDAPFDWDSISNPGRNSAPWWTDMWILIQPTEWSGQGAINNGSTIGNRCPGQGLGLQASLQSLDTLKRLIAQWISLHTYVMSVVLSPSLVFPDGNYGKWYKIVTGNCVASHNDSQWYIEPQPHAPPPQPSLNGGY